MLDFSATGISQVVQRFKKFTDKLGNKIPMYKRIGVKLLNEISNTFKEEAHEGEKWKSLSEVTIKRRRKGKGTGKPKILQDTGTLKRSFVLKVDNIKVIVGTPVEYSYKHEFGEERIPQRKMLPSYKKGLVIAIKVSDDYVKEKIKEVMLR